MPRKTVQLRYGRILFDKRSTFQWVTVMNTLPTTLTKSRIWHTTLEHQDRDQFASERERLRNGFLTFRERAAHLAGEIRLDLPELTVHDVSHMDALWEVASIITGPTYTFTATEAFVLGGAFLLHDLAMSIAATEGGLATIYKDPRWTDLLFSEYQTAYDRDPTDQELHNPEASIRRRVLFSLLRQIHAENAERLPFLSYPASDGAPLFLIEDTEVRQTFGRLIGRIAHSHWWSIGELERNYSRIVGAPHWCPPGWTIDPLNVACTLRVADAAHLDARRAPTFLKAFSNLSSFSESHWRFQEKLNKPYLREDALVFTSGSAFRLPEAGSWWLGLETLRSLDRELRSIDALFSDANHPRFAARSVAGVDLPERLATYIQTDGWLPINATVQVSDLPQVIRSVGGEELYGKRPDVALRELIQNACDAVRARRVYERRGPAFGHITVSLAKSVAGDWWLQVSDDGIGMSQRVLTEFLLDFGRCFWGSSVMQEEFPGLLSSGIHATGKYGIGFFSVFMVASHVQVVTRRSDAAAKDTLVLEFSAGLQGRPILRPATRDEQLIDGGTTVKLRLTNDPQKEGGLLGARTGDPLCLAELCSKMCPGIDVDLSTCEGGTVKRVISADDWKVMDGVDLLSRMAVLHDNAKPNEVETFRVRAAPNLRLLRSDDGELFGRACISAGFGGLFGGLTDLHGVVTIGGLRASFLSGIVGILTGKPLRASRDSAIPLVPDSVLKRWAEQQVELVPRLWSSPEQQSACAQYIRLCGGSTKSLPIAIYRGNWVSVDEIAGMTSLPDEAIIVDHLAIEFSFKQLKSYTLEDTVFVTRASGIPGLLSGRVWLSGPEDEWPTGRRTDSIQHSGRLSVTLAGAVLEALSVAWKIPLEQVLAANRCEMETDVRVGREGDREIRERAFHVVRPIPQSPSN
jgi:hypothetical protein